MTKAKDTMKTHQEETDSKEEVSALKEEIAALKDQLLSCMAEMENVRKRAERDKGDAKKYSITRFAQNLLPVGDHLHLAVQSVPARSRASSELLKTVLTGIESTERELERVFEQAGMTKLVPLHEKFDPNLHEAMFEVETEEHPAKTVVQVIQAGYAIQNRLLRPARVGIARAKAGG